jgi:hypothetical protein
VIRKFNIINPGNLNNGISVETPTISKKIMGTIILKILPIMEIILSPRDR